MPNVYGFFKRQLSTRLLVKGLLFAFLGLVFFALPRLASAQTPVITTSSTTTATHPSQMRHIVKTGLGPLHAFVQVGTETATCAGQSKSGLLWFKSSNGGNSWTCQGQLSSDTTNLMFASATLDASNNIYVVYSQTASGVGTTLDVFYRRISQSGGVWSLGPEQTVRDGTASIGYSYATIEVQATTRLWISARYFDGNDYQVSAYYSDNQGEAPTWQVSQATLNTAGTSSSNHIPQVVRFGLNIGVVYLDNTSDICFRYRPDTWALAKWSIEDCGSSSSINNTTFSAVGGTSGRVYLAYATTNDFVNPTIYFNKFNGVGWQDSPTPINTTFAWAVPTSSISISTDDTSVWIYYLDTSGLNGPLGGDRSKLVYKKGLPPFDKGGDQFDATPTNVVSYHGIFDKYWSYVFGANTYTDDTTSAGNTDGFDVQMVKNVGDIAYFGKLEKFDAIDWRLGWFGTIGDVVWEYWNGTTWAPLTFTTSLNSNFTGNGYGAFTPPSDWATTRVNSEVTPYYYISARVTTAYSLTPTGSQMISIPPMNNISVIPNPGSDKINSIWTENASSPTKVRSASTSVTTSSAPSGTADILPRVITATQDQYNATFTPNARNMVRTSNGTLHSFIYVHNKITVLCSGTPSNGLLYFNSTDSGATWNCRGQLASYLAGFEKHASATVDSANNIYVVYSTSNSTSGDNLDVFYRMLIKGAGSTWTIGPEQLALDGSSTTGFSYAKIIVEGTTRLWLVARYYTTSAGDVVTAYYADDLDTSPTWIQSIAQLSTPGFSGKQTNIAVRYGSNKTGVIYHDNDGKIYMRTHADADDPTSWGTPSLITSTNPVNFYNASGVGNIAGDVFLAWVDESSGSPDVKFSHYDGSTWSSAITVYPAIANDSCISVCDYYVNTLTERDNVVVIAGDYTGISNNLLINGKLSYKKGVAPFGISNFDSSPTKIVSYHGSLDKYWSFVGGSYLDHTAEAASSTAGDTQMVTGVGDIAYFGKLEKFDTLVTSSSVGGAGGNVLWEYWNGASWVLLVSFTDYYNSNFKAQPFLCTPLITCHSFISFTPPSNWSATAVNSDVISYYYIRARVVTAYTTSPVGTQIQTTPWVSFPSVLPEVDDSNLVKPLMHFMWTEGQDLDPGYARVRYASVSAFRLGQAFGLGENATQYIGSRAKQTTFDPPLNGYQWVAGPVAVTTFDVNNPIFIESGPMKKCVAGNCALTVYSSFYSDSGSYGQVDGTWFITPGQEYLYYSEWIGGATGTKWRSSFCDILLCHNLITADLGVDKLPKVAVGGESSDYLVHWGSVTSTNVEAKLFGTTNWQNSCYSAVWVRPDPGPTVLPFPCVNFGWTATW